MRGRNDISWVGGSVVWIAVGSSVGTGGCDKGLAKRFHIVVYIRNRNRGGSVMSQRGNETYIPIN